MLRDPAFSPAPESIGLLAEAESAPARMQQLFAKAAVEIE